MNSIINTQILENNIKKTLIDLKKPMTYYEKYIAYQRLSKAYLYLNNIEQFENNIRKSIENLLLDIENRDINDLYNIYRLKYKKCVLMWLNQENITNICNDILEYNFNNIQKLENGTIIGNKKTNYLQISLIYFLLEDYSNCLNYYSKINNKNINPYIYTISLAIINNDISSLKNLKNTITKSFLKKVPVGTEIDCGIGIWDYYEICLKHLDLPNKIDDIYNYKHGITKINNKVTELIQDNLIQEWTITLIQTVEVSSEIYMNKNFFQLKDLKSIQNIIEPKQFQIIMNNTIKKTIELDTNDWKISPLIAKHEPKHDITDIQNKELYLKNISINGTKKSYLETNQIMDCYHTIIIKSNKIQAEEFSSILSNEFFSKYDELETVLNIIKEKIITPIEFIKFIPYTGFDIEYISLLGIS